MKLIEVPDDNIPFSKTDFITLPVLPFNEQKYGEVVHILADWQKHGERIHREVPNFCQKSFPAGGDQLTRDRIVGALLLRLGNINARDRFNLIGTVTFEFFHLPMNFMEKAVIWLHWSEKTQRYRNQSLMSFCAAEIFNYYIFLQLNDTLITP